MTGLTSNPSIFDKAIARAAATTTRSARRLAGGPTGEELFFDLALEDLRRPPTCSGRSTSGPTASTAGCRSRSRRCSPTTRRAPSRRRKDAARAGSARPTCSSRSPAPPEGLPGDRGGDLRRRAGQRHAALLARAVPAPPQTRTCGASSGASRPGSSPTSARSPRSSSAAGTPPSSSEVPDGAARPARASRSRKRPTGYRDVMDSPRWQRADERRRARRSGCCGRARAPRTRRRSDIAVRQGARRAVHDQHDARGDAAGVRRPRRGRRRCCRPTAATARRCSARFAQAGVDVDALAAKLQARGRQVASSTPGTS